MKAYYNEIDPYAAEWLRNLIKKGHITPGDVDERDIREVRSGDVSGYDRCHFFAGIAGWDLALELAGWGNAPIWTGSCPCQPFSSAGKKKGNNDERHLWPIWFNLIRECRPQHVFGEQVAAAIGHGWLDGISDDLEREGYTVGAVVLPACSVGAPHLRQRLWWLANPSAQGWHSEGRASEEVLKQGAFRRFNRCGDADPWQQSETIDCIDGKTRRTKPGILPLAHGVSARMGKLCAAGNAIVPQVAAEVIKAYMGCRP